MDTCLTLFFAKANVQSGLHWCQYIVLADDLTIVTLFQKFWCRSDLLKAFFNSLLKIFNIEYSPAVKHTF